MLTSQKNEHTLNI